MPPDSDPIELSVIIPAFQAAATLARCLDALSASLPANAELIVVDDASSDRSGEIARTYTSTVIRHEKNLGQIAARKSGVEAAKGDLLVFVDADVVVPEKTLRLIKEHFIANPKVAAVTGRLSRGSPRRTYCGTYKNIYMNTVFAGMPNRCSFLYGAIHALRRSAFRLIHPVYQGVEDNVLGFLLMQESQGIELLQELEVDHLKEYSLLELLANDFHVSRKWALLFCSTQSWKTVLKKGFLHSPRWQQMAIASLGLLILSLPFSPALAAILAVVWLILNRRLLAAMYGHCGARFLAVATGVTFVDQLVQGFGIAVGCAWYLLAAVREKAIIPYPLEIKEV